MTINHKPGKKTAKMSDMFLRLSKKHRRRQTPSLNLIHNINLIVAENHIFVITEGLRVEMVNLLSPFKS